MRKTWILILSALVFCILLLVNSGQDVKVVGVKRSELRSARKIISTGTERFVKIVVCSGITNQLLALEDAVLMAYILDATLILPRLLSEYTLKEPDMDYEELFSKETLISGLQDFVRIVSPSKELQEKIQNYMVIPLKVQYSMLTEASLKSRGFSHSDAAKRSFVVSTDCPLFSVDAEKNQNLLSLRWKVFDSFVLRPELERIKEKIISKVGPRFNALHLRLENDWKKHCLTFQDRWGNNCDFMGSYLPGSTLERLFEIEHVDPNVPIYVASGLNRSEVCAHASIGERFCKKYQLIFKSDVMEETELNRFKKSTPCREIYASLEYSVVSSATVFIGNSVSTFAALQMLHRKATGRKYLQYNGGNIPLERYLGHSQGRDPLKWIFTYSIGSPAHIFEHIKVAVWTAKLNTNLAPFCVADGEDHVTEWLKSNNVHVIVHKSKWGDEFKSQNATFLQSDFARIDIPILGWTDEFVLVTDARVMFLSDVNITHFSELPSYILCGSEKNVERNFGVTLLNVRNMINSYPALMKFFRASFGTKFKNDLGALHAFYAHSFNTFLPNKFNWKPFWKDWRDNRKAVKIVHFDGESISDYESLFQKDRRSKTDLGQRCSEKTSSCKVMLYLLKWILQVKPETKCDAASMMYLVRNNDVLLRNLNAWEHYSTKGKSEGRKWEGEPCQE